MMCLTCGTRPIHARRRCHTRYGHYYKSADFVGMKRQTCEVASCTRPHEAQGLCRMHYMRWSRRGTTDKRPVGRPRKGT